MDNRNKIEVNKTALVYGIFIVLCFIAGVLLAS